MPSVGLWVRFFHFRSQMVPSGRMVPSTKAGKTELVPEKVMSECGAASIYPNLKTDYPNPKPLQSVKKWQRTFFNVRTVDGEADYVNLPPFQPGPPTSKTNWQSKPGHGDGDLDRMMKRMTELRKEGLVAADLVATFILRRVLPLQRRPHRICDMTGHRDCTRTSTVRLDYDEVRDRVCAITELKILDKWWFGLHPYTRKNQPPKVTALHICLNYSCPCADLTPKPTSLQLFIAQLDFKDGQTSAEGQSDRA